MSEEMIKSIAIRIVGRIAPEAPLDKIEPNRRFRDQFEFDSVDFLTFVTELQKELNIRIPEMDYPNLASLKGCVDYLQSVIGHNEPATFQQPTGNERES